MVLNEYVAELESRVAVLEKLVEVNRRHNSPERTMEIIILHVALAYRISLAEFLGPARPDRIAWPRQVAMFLCRRFTKLSTPTIGAAFGGRNHGTVLHAISAVQNRFSTDPKIRADIESWINFFENKNIKRELS
jgi:chromosomal replication initiator protein